jgi:hypothetical protein
VEFKPGLADETLRELAPLLAEDGIDVDNLEVADLPMLQRALNRAVERRNLELFSPIGATREIAVVHLRRIVEAILTNDTRLAGEPLDQVHPESPGNTVATVASCIGVALGLLDNWLGVPSGGLRFGAHIALPAGHWNGERAATDTLALARKGKAFRSLDKLLVRQGGPQVLAGSALALAAAVTTHPQHGDTPTRNLLESLIR